MMWLIKLIYKLLGVYTRIHIINTKNEVLRHDVKIKFIPRVGDLIYFEEGGPYFSVMKVVHHIQIRHEIWIVSQEISYNEQYLNKKN